MLLLLSGMNQWQLETFAVLCLRHAGSLPWAVITFSIVHKGEEWLGLTSPCTGLGYWMGSGLFTSLLRAVAHVTGCRTPCGQDPGNPENAVPAFLSSSLARPTSFLFDDLGSLGSIPRSGIAEAYRIVKCLNLNCNINIYFPIVLGDPCERVSRAPPQGSWPTVENVHSGRWLEWLTGQYWLLLVELMSFKSIRFPPWPLRPCESPIQTEPALGEV